MTPVASPPPFAADPLSAARAFLPLARRLALAGEVRGQRGAGARVGLRHRGGRALGDDHAALGAGAGAEIDDPVGGADDVEIVIDDDHARPGAREVGEGLVEPRHLGRVEAGAGLVEDEERAAARLAQGARELDPLRLAAGERGERLPEREVAEPELAERAEGADDARLAREEDQGLVDGHREHVVRALALDLDLQDLVAEALPRQVGQVSATSARNCISMVSDPSPEQASQRPSATLNEKCPGVNPRSWASGWAANMARMRFHAVVYVAGLPREVRPSAP